MVVYTNYRVTFEQHVDHVGQIIMLSKVGGLRVDRTEPAKLHLIFKDGEMAFTKTPNEPRTFKMEIISGDVTQTAANKISRLVQMLF